MKVEFINCYNTYNSHVNCKQPAFKAHADFNKLSRYYDELTASSYFRRGKAYGSAADEYTDVINTLNTIFTPNISEKKSMLIAGIGESQEPFSYLAVIKNLLKDKPLAEYLDLYIVDLQSKPDNKKLFEQSYCNEFRPRYVQSSFIRDEGEKYGIKHPLYYRVKDEIFEFLKETYNNPEKSHWDTRIQEFMPKIKPETFDIISINNTLGYIKNDCEIIKTIDKTVKALKQDGVFITDPYSRFNRFCLGRTYETYRGIFKRY